MCVYIHIYIYIYMYVCIYIYIYIGAADEEYDEVLNGVTLPPTRDLRETRIIMVSML